MEKGTIDWKRLLDNCKKDGIIEKNQDSKVLYKALDNDKRHWFETIIETEPVDLEVDSNSEFNEKEWPLGGLLIALLKDGCDPNVKIIDKDKNLYMTMLKYAEKLNKKQSFKILEENGARFSLEELE